MSSSVVSSSVQLPEWRHRALNLLAGEYMKRRIFSVDKLAHDQARRDEAAIFHNAKGNEKAYGSMIHKRILDVRLKCYAKILEQKEQQKNMEVLKAQSEGQDARLLMRKYDEEIKQLKDNIVNLKKQAAMSSEQRQMKYTNMLNIYCAEAQEFVRAFANHPTYKQSSEEAWMTLREASKQLTATDWTTKIDVIHAAIHRYQKIKPQLQAWAAEVGASSKRGTKRPNAPSSEANVQSLPPSAKRAVNSQVNTKAEPSSSGSVSTMNRRPQTMKSGVEAFFHALIQCTDEQFRTSCSYMKNISATLFNPLDVPPIGSKNPAAPSANMNTIAKKELLSLLSKEVTLLKNDGVSVSKIPHNNSSVAFVFQCHFQSLRWMPDMRVIIPVQYPRVPPRLSFDSQTTKSKPQFVALLKEFLAAAHKTQTSSSLHTLVKQFVKYVSTRMKSA